MSTDQSTTIRPRIREIDGLAIRFAESCIGLGMAQSPICYPHAKIAEADFTKRI